MIKVSGKDLGIDNCNYVASGQTAGDVLKKMVAHLEQEHNMHMPPADDLLDLFQTEQDRFDWTLAPVVNARFPLDEGAILVLRRLKEKLHLPNTLTDNRVL